MATDDIDSAEQETARLRLRAYMRAYNKARRASDPAYLERCRDWQRREDPNIL